MNTRTVISNARDCFVEVTNHDTDPNSWIVNRWTGRMPLRKRVSSNWFIDKKQAFAYADELKRAHEERLRSLS
jgi:hypothetical protein